MFCGNCGAELLGNFCTRCGVQCPSGSSLSAVGQTGKRERGLWGPLILVPIGVSLHILLCTVALIWTLSLLGSDDELTRVFPARYGSFGTLEFFEHVPNHLLLWIAVALALTLGIMSFYLMRLLRRKKQFLRFAILAALLGAIFYFSIMNRIGPYATLREDVHGNWIRSRAFVSAFHYNDDTGYGNLLNFIGTMSFFELVGIPVLAFSKRRKTTFVN
jgi:hypothetical protein